MLNKTDCLPKEEIDKELAHAFLIFFSIDNDIRLNDLSNPFKPFLKSESIPISTTLFKIFNRELSDIRINTDHSLLFSNFEETKNYKFTQKSEEVDLRSENTNIPGTFNQMRFYANGNTHIFNRSYTKLFEVIVQIGGFSHGIIYSTFIILYIYSKNIILWNCIYSIISEKEIKENLEIPIGRLDNNVINPKKIFEKKNVFEENNIIAPSQLQINRNNNDCNLRYN